MSTSSSIESIAAESVQSADSEPERAVEETADERTEDAERAEEREEAEETPGADEGNRPPLRSRRWVRWTGLATTAAVVVASLSAAVVFGWKLKEDRDVDSAADQAREAARQYAVTLTSVNSDHLDQDFTAVLNGATGEFKNMYSQSSAQLRQLLADNKATAHGTVVDAGIKSATKNRVEVLLFIDQTVTNTVTPDPRVDRSRVVMTMQRVGGRWLADKVDLP
ncbi:hypothetical protein [Nocardia miyunensis]|uniref:hypothetical protein n=1 Tax=Nocardia miyunensis TaxID=282684 RepID=UPI000AB754B4|nr:hypothetical protein [Nocardia miyunensis]